MTTGNSPPLESRCFALMDHASDGILLVGHDRRIRDLNRRMGELLLAERSSLIDRSALSIVPHDQRKHLEAFIAEVTPERQLRGEFNLESTDGSVIPVELTVSTLEQADGTCCIGTFRDLSVAKQAEMALRESEARHRAIFEYAGIGIEVCDAEGIITEVNRTFLDMLGFPQNEILGRHWSELIHEDDPRVHLSYEWACEHPVVVEQRFRRKDGRLLWAEVTLTTVNDAHGRLRYIIALITDVTQQHFAEAQRRRHEEELKRARKLAEEGSAAKTRFLATASHDLRQPIQAIHLLVHLLAEQQLPPASVELVSRLRSAVDGFAQMIDSLLDISKLDAGLVTADVRDFNLGSLLAQLADEYRPIAEEKGLALSVVPSALWVRSDRTLLTRILSNLLSNAVRHTAKGAVLVGARRKGEFVWVQVHDTGPGIPEEEVSRIFDEFHQLGNEARDRREGLGLGLAIVEKLTNLLGHEVRVDSEVGRGTVFSVSVPRAPRGKAEARNQLMLPIGYEGAPILVVDDDVDIRDGLRLTLTRWGYKATAVADLAQAVEACQGPEPPMLVIADYRLQGANGMDVIRALRRECGRDLAALLLTGDASPEREREAANEGLRLLRKPITSDELRSAVVGALESSRAKLKKSKKPTV